MKNRNAPITTWITIFALLLSMCAGLTLSQRTAAQSEKPNPEQSALQYPSLSKYATDLTLLAVQGRLPRSNERAADVDRVIASLTRTEKTPVLVGESDLDRNIVARGVALKIASGDVPDELRTARGFSLRTDKLAEDAKAESEFAGRVNAVFQEVGQAKGRVILFVDQLQDYVGVRAGAVTSTTVREAIEANQVSIIGGASPESFASYIAKDAEVAKLFKSILMDSGTTVSSGLAESRDSRRSPIKEEFEGEKISSDMQEMIDGVGPNGRINAIVQVDDVHNAQVLAFLKRYGANIDGRMAQLGAMKVELPAKAIASLAKIDGANFISPDVKLESFGHVTATTGTDLIRTQSTTTTSVSLLGLTTTTTTTTTYDGAGIGIAILDSGIDNTHDAFAGSRIKFNKDFTTENAPTYDPFGHGSHVASAAAGVSTSGTTFQGIAPGASIINLRVLDKNGVGSASTR